MKLYKIPILERFTTVGIPTIFLREIYMVIDGVLSLHQIRGYEIEVLKETNKHWKREEKP